MPQTWTSDDTDAAERLKIQYGTSLVYPVSAMGALVSAVPNHQVGRVTPLSFRGDVAMSGNFGYELDLTKFTDEEKELVKEQVANLKKFAAWCSMAICTGCRVRSRATRRPECSSRTISARRWSITSG